MCNVKRFPDGLLFNCQVESESDFLPSTTSSFSSTWLFTWSMVILMVTMTMMSKNIILNIHDDEIKISSVYSTSVALQTFSPCHQAPLCKRYLMERKTTTKKISRPGGQKFQRNPVQKGHYHHQWKCGCGQEGQDLRFNILSLFGNKIGRDEKYN